MPKNKAIEEMPGSLNINFIIGARSFADILTIAVCCSSSDMIRNGKSEGTITVYQSESADLAELSMSLGKMMQKIVIKKTMKEKSM
jgi:hypothetical protein